MTEWVQAISDLTIALSYFSIPVSLASFAAEQDLRLSYLTTVPRLAYIIKALIVLVIAFIGLCGVTHLLSSIDQWAELLVIAMVFKIMTAIVSFATATFLHYALPILLSCVREIELTKRGLPEHLERINQMIFCSSGNMLSVHNIKNLSFETVNDSVAALGLSKEAVLSGSLYDIVEDEDKNLIKECVGRLKQAPASTQEVKYHIWDLAALRKRTMEASIFFEREPDDNNNDASHVLVISRDVTDREERDMVQQERARLVEANQTRTRYMSAIAHDLKTPLTTFKLCLGLMQADEISSDQIAILQEAEVAVEMMSVIIGQALDSGRIENGYELQPRRGRVDIRDLVSKCDKIMSKYGKCVPLTSHIAPDVSSHVVTDGDWAWQMCINLLTNACKYTVKGYIHLEVSVVLGNDLPQSPLLRGNTRMNEAKSTGGPEGRNDSRGHVRQASTPSGLPRTSGGRRPPTGKGTVCPVTCPTDREDSTSSSLSGQPTDWDAKKFLSFNVRDTGIGVTHENKPQLFKAFTQVQSMQSHGTGLGLYSVGQKALRLGGSFGMMDNTHEACGGSEFFFAVPYLPDEHDGGFSSLQEDVDGGESLIGEQSRRNRLSSGDSVSQLSPGTTPCFSTLDATTRDNPSSFTAPSTLDDAPSALNPSKTAEVGARYTMGASFESHDHLVQEGSRDSSERKGSSERGRGRGRERVRNVEVAETTAETDVGGGDVLVVDDTSTVRSLLKRAVSRLGLTVDTASTGQEALNMVEKRPYRMVLCDLQMPVMDGPEFTARWRSRERQGKVSPSRKGARQTIIGMSANSEAPEINACKECGMDGFCPKPITLPVLKTMISNHCGNIDRNQPHTSTSADSGNGGRGGGGGLEEAEGGKWRPPQRPISGSTLSGNMRDAGGEGEKDTDQDAFVLY